jgi:hypothetical protein
MKKISKVSLVVFAGSLCVLLGISGCAGTTSNAGSTESSTSTTQTQSTPAMQQIEVGTLLASLPQGYSEISQTEGAAATLPSGLECGAQTSMQNNASNITITVTEISDPSKIGIDGAIDHLKTIAANSTASTGEAVLPNSQSIIQITYNEPIQMQIVDNMTAELITQNAQGSTVDEYYLANISGQIVARVEGIFAAGTYTDSTREELAQVCESIISNL